MSNTPNAAKVALREQLIKMCNDWEPFTPTGEMFRSAAHQILTSNEIGSESPPEILTARILSLIL